MSSNQYKSVYLFLNGEPPSLNLIAHLGKASFVIAADGAAEYLKDMDIKPDLIIGDLDSISNDTFNYFKSLKVEQLKIAEQETTDFEKALMFIKANLDLKIYAFGGFSSRPDHMLNNFSVLKRYHKILDIKLINDIYESFFIKDKIEFGYKPGEVVSLLAMPKAAGINTTGLEYALQNDELEFGVREGSLNKASSDKIIISFTSGDLLLTKKHFGAYA